LEAFAHPAYAVALGVLISLFYFLISTENPARIPLHKVFVRALFGIILYLITWLIIAYPVYLLLQTTISWAGKLEGLGLYFFAAAVGLSVPIAVREGKNHLLGRRTAQTYRLLTVVLQFIDEATSQYFGRIIMREERKASYEVLEGDQEGAERAIHRLFEVYIEELAKEEARNLKPAKRQKVFNFTKMRSPAVKFKYLLRHLGYDNCFKRVRDVQRAPHSILPMWPPALPDRRRIPTRRLAAGIHNPERRQIPHGRRKLDCPDTRSIIIGE
jgi:hypothetical protein